MRFRAVIAVDVDADDLEEAEVVAEDLVAYLNDENEEGRRARLVKVTGRGR